MADNAKLSKSKLLYVVRDIKGEIDNSDLFLLKSVYTVCSMVKVILCGDFKLDDASFVFQEFCDEVVIRESSETDYDVLAEEILSHESDGYDELVFLNNSVFGCFYPVYQFVGVMRKKEYDFWGLTKTGEIVTEQWEFVPEHLQLYFFVIEKKMLHSESLHNFFRQKSLGESFEYEFTSCMEKYGFRWGTYINLPNYDSNSVIKNFNLLYEVSLKLIKEYRFPFLKKDYFTKKDFSNSNAADLRNSVDFLAEQNLYDMDLLWDCVLRKYNIGQIKDSMNFDFILSCDNHETVPLSDEDYRKTAIIMHLAYQESIDEIFDYILEIPGEIKKFFVVTNEKLENYLEKQLVQWNYENYEIRLMNPNRGRDMNSLFVVCRDVWQNYTYLCFTHDKRTSVNFASDVVGKEFMNILWDNTLKSRGYIKRVLALLKNRKRLGYLTVPSPYHAIYCETSVRAWGGSFDITRELAEKMNIKADISREFLPFALGNGFWCKTMALQDIVNYHLTTSDFCEEPMPSDGTISHALERIMIYAAQNAGFYSGIVENTEYAQNELVNKNYMLKHIMEKILMQPQFYMTTTFSRLVRFMGDNSLDVSLENRKKLYIWGAGKSGKGMAKVIERMGYFVEGYICSDGYEKPKDSDKKVYYISEINCDDPEVGIILAIHKKFYGELRSVLEDFKDQIYYI